MWYIQGMHCNMHRMIHCVRWNVPMQWDMYRYMPSCIWIVCYWYEILFVLTVDDEYVDGMVDGWPDTETQIWKPVHTSVGMSYVWLSHEKPQTTVAHIVYLICEFCFITDDEDWGTDWATGSNPVSNMDLLAQMKKYWGKAQFVCCCVICHMQYIAIVIMLYI